MELKRHLQTEISYQVRLENLVIGECFLSPCEVPYLRYIILISDQTQEVLVIWSNVMN